MNPAWKGSKFQFNSVTIAEIKPHMKDTFKVVYAEKPDLGPNNYGYASHALAQDSVEKTFGL